MTPDQLRLMEKIAKEVGRLGKDFGNFQKMFLEHMSEHKLGARPIEEDAKAIPMKIVSTAEAHEPNQNFKMDVHYEAELNLEAPDRMARTMGFFNELELLLRSYRITRLEGFYDRPKKTYGTF